MPFERSTAPPFYRSTVLLLDHPHPDFGLDVGVKADRHAVHAQRLDRLVEIDLALLEVEALRLELCRNVRRSDGAKKFAFFADLESAQRAALAHGRWLVDQHLDHGLDLLAGSRAEAA